MRCDYQIIHVFDECLQKLKGPIQRDIILLCQIKENCISTQQHISFIDAKHCSKKDYKIHRKIICDVMLRIV